METTVTGSDTEAAATARRQTVKNMNFFGIAYVFTVSLLAMFMVYILPLLMALLIQGKAWYSHCWCWLLNQILWRSVVISGD
jgi:hypothetical protein